MGTGICYVFGGGERTDCTITFEKEDLVIAADAGFDYLNDLGLRADVVLGDFDSVISYDLPSDSLRYPKEKDDTDMMLALKLGLERGYTEFRIYGGMGGRLEHTLANLQCLIYLKQCSAVGYLMDDKTTAFVMQNETVWFKPEAKGFLSLFSLGEKASGVTIRNLKYEMQNGEITNSFPIGISNEFIGKRSSVTVEQGMLAVILSEKE